MMEFLSQNAGNILVAAIVAAVVILIIRKMFLDKRKGKTSCGCGCGCSQCPSAGRCHDSDMNK